jgi:hypothetical protein
MPSCPMTSVRTTADRRKERIGLVRHDAKALSSEPRAIQTPGPVSLHWTDGHTRSANGKRLESRHISRTVCLYTTRQQLLAF